MKLDDVELLCAKTTEEVISILSKARPEFIPMLYGPDIQRIAKYIVACNVHNHKIIGITLPLYAWYDHKVWPNPNSFPGRTGTIQSILVWVQGPKKIIKKNFTLQQVFDIELGIAIDKQRASEVLKSRLDLIESKKEAYRAAAEKLKTKS
jgi:hypothetical protein